MAATQKNREARIKTPFGEDILFLSNMTVNEELGRLFSIDLELLSDKEDIKFEDLLGQNVTIEIDLINDETTYFNGYISRFSQLGNIGANAVYQATVRPWFWFLTRTADCRIFQEMTVPDIVKEVFRDLGYTDFEDKLVGNYRNYTYCVQYRETDFNFVSRLLEQEGIYYYFTHDDGKHTLILSDDFSAHDLLAGVAEIPYYPPDETAVKDEEYISSWFVSKQVQPGKYELNEYDFERPKAVLTAKSSVVREHSVADYEIYDYPGEYVESDHGENYAQIRIEELHTQYEQVQAQSNIRVLKTGGLFKLKEYPREDQNREYLITSATHSIHSDSSRFASGSGVPVYSNNFTAIDSKTAYRTARVTPRPIIQGAQTAKVVGPAGEEIHTDEHGRVKLQFYWDRYGESNENSSCWVRVSQVHAGKGFGGIDIPRIGEEVIVSFEEGDPDKPLVTGRVYNGDNKAPNGLPAKKMVSGLKSNTTPGGGGDNSIMLDDTKEKEKLSIHAQYDMDTTVEHDQANTINNNRTTSVVVDDTENIGNDQKIDVGVDQTVTVGNDQTITIGANQNKDVGVNQTFSIGANQEITVGSNQDVSIGANQDLSVGANQKSAIAGNRTVSVGGSDSLTVGGKQQISVSGPIEIESAAKITLKGGGSMIEISAGGIVIQSSGQITVQGSIIKLN